MPPINTSVCVYIYGTAACLIQALHKDTHSTVFSVCVPSIHYLCCLFQNLIHQTSCKPAVISRPTNETVTGVIEAIFSLRFLVLRHYNELIQPFP